MPEFPPGQLDIDLSELAISHNPAQDQVAVTSDGVEGILSSEQQSYFHSSVKIFRNHVKGKIDPTKVTLAGFGNLGVNYYDQLIRFESIFELSARLFYAKIHSKGIQSKHPINDFKTFIDTIETALRDLEDDSSLAKTLNEFKVTIGSYIKIARITIENMQVK